MAHPEWQTTIIVVGRAGNITNGFASAIEAEGWWWEEVPDAPALSARSLPVRTLITMPIPAFTPAVYETIRLLAIDRSLPVVIFGTDCRSEVIDAVLRAGADEFLPLPVTIEEMIARLAAVIRVRLGAQSEAGCSDFQLDEAARTVSIAQGEPIELSVSEYRLLRMLLAARNRPVAGARLATVPLPHAESDGQNALDAMMSRLRRKMGADRIVTVRGVGYQLIDHRQPPDNVTYLNSPRNQPVPQETHRTITSLRNDNQETGPLRNLNDPSLHEPQDES